jgi:hypothetical protein
MAISNIPKIKGPDFGGVIYGLNVNLGYSTESSKLKLDIVSKNGEYTLPSDWAIYSSTSLNIEFGNFKFFGYPWSYSLKRSASETTLNIEIIDGSVILDRYYVLLWKRGLFGLKGSLRELRRTFNFNEESILVPRVNNGNGFPYTDFVTKNLGTETITSKSYSLGSSRVGSVIVIGHEKFANSVCDIPDTYYTFNDLKNELSKIPINMNNAPNNNTWKATHEGTLREVLSSWCADLGFDYYWDFRNNTLNFYAANKGIKTVLVDSNSSNIISKEQSESMEGTFVQYGVAYTAIPKSPLKSLTTTRSNTILYSISPIPVSYFMNRNGQRQSLNSDKGRWGGKRSQNDFIEAGLLGFVSRSLRDLYCFQNEHWEVLGYKINSGISTDKAKLLTALTKFGFQDMIKDLEKFDAKNLPNYNFDFISRETTIADKWFEIEQKMLEFYGKYYRIPDSPGSFFYCNASFTVEIEISVEPDGQSIEDNSINFAGKKVFDRSGRLSHDASSALELLKYSDFESDINKCAPIHIDLAESGILDGCITSGLLTQDQAKVINTLVIYPKNNTFVRGKLGFTSRFNSGKAHPLEQTITDIKNANSQSGRKNCQSYEDNLKKGSCISAEETARERAITKAGGVTNTSVDPDDYISGLITKPAHSCVITLKSAFVEIFTPSYGSYQVVCRYNITVNKISAQGTEEFLWSVGSPGSANHVAEIRIANENITDPEEDSFQSQRPTTLIRPADVDCSTPQKQIKYVFAGEPPSNITLSPQEGLSSLDITLSSDGFITSAVFSTKPPKFSKSNNVVRYVHSQFNRASYNAS